MTSTSVTTASSRLKEEPVAKRRRVPSLGPGYAFGHDYHQDRGPPNNERLKMSSFSPNIGAPAPQENFQQQAAQHYAQTNPAFNPSPTSQGKQQNDSSGTNDAQFDIFEWHPKYASCQRYFLDHAQHSAPVQAMAAFMNILLPCQRNPSTHTSRVPSRSSDSAATRLPGFPNTYTSAPPNSSGSNSTSVPPTFPCPDPPSTSLFPYLRRLVVTGLDFPGVLHGFFGNDWASGIGPLHEQERRNLLFAAKSSGWMGVKKDYDMGWEETVPFLRPLQQAVEPEVSAAERSWSEWLAMEDWMVGPRAPAPGGQGGQGMSGGATPGGMQGMVGGQGAEAGINMGMGEARMTGTERAGDEFAS